jgi:hypothetical protein
VSRDVAASTSASVHPGTNLPTIQNTRCRLDLHVFKILYGLKQSGRVWYARFTDEMIALDLPMMTLHHAYLLNIKTMKWLLLPSMLMISTSLGHQKLVDKTIERLNKTLKMKDLKNTKFCLGL